MNLRFTLIVALVAVALVVFAFTLRDTASKQVGSGAPTATPESILNLNEADIEEVAVVGPTAAYTLSRVAGGWQVDGKPAGTEVDSVITTLAKPTVLRELPADRKPEDYGFATPSLTVTLKTAAGESHVIVVGDKAVAEDNRYIRLGNEGPIVLVSNYDFENLIKWLTEPPLAPTPTATGPTAAATTESTAEQTEGAADAGEATAAPVESATAEVVSATATAPPTMPPAAKPTAKPTSAATRAATVGASATAKPKASATSAP